MKKVYALAIAMVLMASTTAAMAFDLKGALKGLAGSAAGQDGSSTAGTITNLLGNVLSTDKLEVSSLQGNWKYSAPAVTFKSENLLKKAGGAAAATMVTGKLEPIYKTLGFNKMTINIEQDGTFAMKVRGITLKGTIEQMPEGDSSNANFVFNFQAGTFNIGKINAYVEKSVLGEMKLMFDVTKLMTLLQTVGKVANLSTLNTLNSLLSNYDGLCAGFELKK